MLPIYGREKRYCRRKHRLQQQQPVDALTLNCLANTCQSRGGLKCCSHREVFAKHGANVSILRRKSFRLIDLLPTPTYEQCSRRCHPVQHSKMGEGTTVISFKARLAAKPKQKIFSVLHQFRVTFSCTNTLNCSR
jgi:hypothetical protein